MNTLTRGLAASLLLSSAAFAQTTISAVEDGAAYTSDIAQGSVFVVKGTGLSAPGITVANAPAYPTILNSVQITFTPAAGGTAVQALMVYLYNAEGRNQLAAVLPSNVATGSYAVRVINGGTTSAPVTVNVVARKPGIVTASGNGAGIAQATLSGALILQRLADVGRIDIFDTRPARQGERVDLWGTGLGADRASDTGGSSGDQTGAGNIRVIVEGQEITPLYAGRSQNFPGLDQVVFNLPTNVRLGCFISVQVRAGGVLSNAVSISVSDSATCTEPGLTSEVLRKFSLGQATTIGVFTVNTGSFEAPLLGTTYADSIGGTFSAYTADGYLNAGFGNSVGTCTVFKRRGDFNSLLYGAAAVGLDAGATLTGSKPDNSTATLTKTAGSTNLYSVTLVSGSPTRVFTVGTYRLAGTGGADIGAFNTQILVPNFTWTNRSAVSVLNRSQPLTINWTGGATGLVTITGLNGKSVPGSGSALNATVDATGFVCTAPAGAGTFTVPTSVLQQMTPVTLDLLSLTGSNFSVGALLVAAVGDPQAGGFTALLTRGGSIDRGLFTYTNVDAKLLNIQ